MYIPIQRIKCSGDCFHCELPDCIGDPRAKNILTPEEREQAIARWMKRLERRRAKDELRRVGI